MPRAKSNPSHSGTHMAHYADVRAAWEHAKVTQAQREALLLTLGVGMTQGEAGAVLGISQEAASQRSTAGLCNLATYLNGEEIGLDGVDLAA